MKPAEDGRRYNVARVLDGAMDRSVLVRDQYRARGSTGHIRYNALCRYSDSSIFKQYHELLKLISAQLEETSRGVISFHHFHNVHCGIENILSLLEYTMTLLKKQINSHAERPATSHAMI
jgi:hypothetical protein